VRVRSACEAGAPADDVGTFAARAPLRAPGECRRARRPAGGDRRASQDERQGRSTPVVTAAPAGEPLSDEGLSSAEANARLAAHGPRQTPTSRSTASIVRANVVTPFNVILTALGVVTLVFGDWRDALFLGIVVTNAGIGIWQELRAKNALDELAALVAPNAVVVRDGEQHTVGVADVVEGDLVRLTPGDQVVADGRLVSADGLELDESVLTGESRPVLRAAGDEVRSGSFAVDGTGSYRVDAVGPDSYAERLVGEV